MTDIRRTMLWVVFSMSLVFLWDAWQKHTGHPSMFSPAPAKTVDSTNSPSSGTSKVAGTGTAATTQENAVALPSEKVTITTDLVKATFDSRGGSLVELELLTHKDATDPSKLVKLFDRSSSRVYLAETGLLGQSLPKHTSLMKVVTEEREMRADDKQLKLVFESATEGGVKLRKTYVFARGSYAIEVTHEFTNVGEKTVSPRLYLQLVRDGKEEPSGLFMAPTSFTGPAVHTEQSKFQKISFSDIQKGKATFQKTATDGWISMVQHYFASAWLAPEGLEREYRVDQYSVDGMTRYAVAMVLQMPEIQPNASHAQSATLFAGPQEENKLASLAPGLELVRDYGYLTILAKPLFWLLDKLHSVIGNWGWAIVALVGLLKIAFYWLNASAYRSMAKMKSVAPRVTEMRERLKDKPQEMQQEMMRIYREEKINPLGGCLPILVQMPFFIALYSVLLASVEMRGAPWLGWIVDLSARDPYFILPLLMTGTTLLQTWLNPTPPDPMQAKMMWIMPLLFSGMFFVFPAGLVLYWLTNNILSITQQYLINKQLGVLDK